MKVYTKQHLFEALQKAGLPASYKTLLKYERLGIIPRDSEMDVQGVHGTRFYSEKEINQIVERVKKHKFKNA